MPSSKHLAQSAHDELFKFFVSGGAGKALYSGAGHDVFGLRAVYAAAFKIEKRGVVQFTDGRAVVAGDVFLRSEDEGHRLVDGVLAQHEDGLLLVTR